MDEHRPEKIEESESVRRRSEWIRPEVDRLLAGGAEATDGADTDGPTLS